MAHLLGHVFVLTDEYLDGILALGEGLLHQTLHVLPFKSIVAAADSGHSHFGDLMVALQRHYSENCPMHYFQNLGLDDNLVLRASHNLTDRRTRPD